MTHVPAVRATGPTDLLALVPGVPGFHPEDSLVVMTLGECRQPVHARVDLPTDPVTLEEVAAHLTAVVARNGVRAVALVVYSDDDALAEDLVADLADRLWEVETEVVCAVRADGERWWVLGAAGGGPGTPYDLSVHPLTVRTVAEGRVVLADRRALADTLVGDPEEVEAVAEQVDALLERFTRLHGRRLLPAELRTELVAHGRWVQERVRRGLEDRERLDAADVARLVLLFEVSGEVRDVVYALLDRDTALGHVDLWRDVVRRTPAELQAAPAALLACAAWVSGDGALAWCGVDRALAAQPDHPLATHLARALAEAVPPSTWEPFPEEALTLFHEAARP